MSRQPTIEKLLEPHSIEIFFKDYYEKKHLVVQKNDSTVFKDILNTDDLDSFFQSKIIPTGTISLVQNGDTIPFQKWSIISNTKNGIAHTVSNERLFNFFNDGATIIVNSAEKSIPNLSDFSSRIEHELGFRCQCNLYITPGNAQGFKLHHDDHDVFIMQSKGSKLWKIYHSPTKLPTRKWNYLNPYEQDTAGDPIDQFTLEQGDLLYIPRGYIHCAETTSAPSVHITLGLHPICTYELLKALVKHAEDLPELRKAIPINHRNQRTRQDLELLFKQKIHEILDNISIDELIDLRHTINLSLRNIHMKGRFSSYLSIESVNLDTVLVKDERLMFGIEKSEDKAVKVTNLLKELTFPSFMRTSIESLLANSEIQVRDIDGMITDNGKIDLAKQFVRTGLLTLKSIPG